MNVWLMVHLKLTVFGLFDLIVDGFEGRSVDNVEVECSLLVVVTQMTNVCSLMIYDGYGEFGDG